MSSLRYLILSAVLISVIWTSRTIAQGFSSTWSWESNTVYARAGARITTCDVNADGFPDMIITGVNSTYAFWGGVSGMYNSTPDWSVYIYNSNLVLEGLGLECADVNSDGYDDIIVGSWNLNPQHVYVYSGSFAGPLTTASQTLTNSVSGSWFGEYLHSNDFNNDGHMDLAVGAYGSGRVFVYYSNGAGGLSTTNTAPAILTNGALNYGIVLASADFSEDGSPDLVIASRTTGSVGAVYIVSGTSSGLSNTYAWQVNGTVATGTYGYDLATGDYNGDGHQDLAVLANGAISIYIYYGTGDLATLPRTPSVTISTVVACRVLASGNVNGDAYTDLLVGCSASFTVRLFYGGPTLGGPAALTITNSTATNTGFAVAVLPNLDGIGQSEIAYSAWSYSNGENNEGIVKIGYSLAASPSPSASPSVSPSASVTPSLTPSPVSPSASPSVSASASTTPSVSPSSSVTPSISVSPTVTPSVTPSVSPTRSSSPSSSTSRTPSASPSSSPTPTPSVTPTRSVTPTPSSSVSPSPSATPSSSPSRTPSVSTSVSPTSTPSVTPSSSTTPSVSPSASPAATVCIECTSNADCSDSRGVCITSSIGSYCSCLSGFGGCDCSELPSSFCNTSYSQVNALSGSFQANATVDYLYPQLFIRATANLEESVWGNGGATASNTPPYSTETLIFFGPSSSSYPNCSYPNGGDTWKDLPATFGACNDFYLANMTWNFAKDNCGFASVNGSRNYTQTITILRKYNLNGILTRTEQTTRNLYVVFPEEVSVTDSNVTVSFPSSDVFAAITFIDYNPSTLLWAVTVQTSVAEPYSLSPPVSSFLTGNLNLRAPSVTVTNCTSVSSYCVQTIQYTYPQGSVSDACLGLFGSDRHSFPAQCTTSTCPGAGLVNITLQLNTGNACPSTDLIQFSEATLQSFSDASVSTPQDSFTINDVAYFGASVQSTEALISSRSIKPNTVCFQPTAGSCFYVNYTVIPSSNGKDPVFAVDLHGPGNYVYFSNITSPTDFSVKATVVVDFVGAKGLRKNIAQTQSVETIATAVIQGESTVLSGGSTTNPFIFVLALLMLLLI